MLKTKSFADLIRLRSVRLKITAGYLLVIGLSAAGLTAGFAYGERFLESPALERQNTAFNTLIQLNLLQGSLLENKLSLLPYVGDPSQISDSGHRLTLKSEQLLERLDAPHWKQLPSPAAHESSLSDSVGMVRCRQAAIAYHDTLQQLLNDRPLGQVPSQLDLVALMSGPAAQQMENCAIDLQRLIADAELVQANATQTLAEARQLHKRLAQASLLASLAVAIGLALYTSRHITRPLQQASQVARQVSERNNFNLRVQTQSHDEVGTLARSFNQLLDRVQYLLTEQQKDKQQLEQYSHHLEATVTSRTLELTQKNQTLKDTLKHLQRTQSQLIQAEKMSGLGQMVAGIAHEINNPVNFIHGNLAHAKTYAEDLLHLIAQYQEHCPQPPNSLQSALDDADLPFIEKDIIALFQSMRTGTQRIREIVLSLRNFSRLDEAELKTVNLHEGIESTLMILGHRLKAQPPQKEIEVIRDYGDLPVIRCHASQINQVFMNILANAIDALESQRQDPSRPPQIQITTAVSTEAVPGSSHLAQSTTGGTPNPAQSEPWAVITITDNGSGISPEAQSRLFEPFFTTKPVGQGTGLGLSISYQIVTEHHNGHLCCKSSPQMGTAFQIWLPLTQPSLAP